MKSKKHNIIIVFMGLVILALVGGLIYTNSTANARVTSVDATLEAVRTKKSTLEAALYREQIKNVEVECDSNKLADALSKAAALKMRLMCPVKIFNVDYNNNDLVADAIKAHLKEYFTNELITNDWTPIYGISQTATHNYYWGGAQYTFIVFFNNSEYDTENGIFDTIGQCWANLNNE